MYIYSEFVYRVSFDFSTNDTSIPLETLQKEITTERVINAAKKTFNNSEIIEKQNTSRSLANSYSLFVRGFVLDKRVFKHYEKVIKGAFFNSRPGIIIIENNYKIKLKNC